MKTQLHLPLMTYPDPTSFTLLKNAVELARVQGADLNISIHKLKVPAISPPFPSIFDAEDLVVKAEHFSRDAGEELRRTIQDYAEQDGIGTDISLFECAEPFVGTRFAEMSRIFDLTILEASDIGRPTIESILFESGRPLLLFPSEVWYGQFETVAIAWDGSPTLARALSCAKPYMDESKKIILISVTDDKAVDTDLRDQFATVLRRSGLAVEVVSAHSDGEPTASVVQAEAVENGANLLVAGGFGHSRFREFILGGVTRSLLQNLKMPLLLSH